MLTITTSNDYASSTLGSVAAGGAIGGTLTTALTFTTPQPPVQDPVAQATRANLVDQYNNILAQIDTTSQDSSFNGVNLLNGDTLKLVFNETGKSTLSINGVTFNSAGLGLSNLVDGRRLHRQRRDQQGADDLERGLEHAALGGLVAGFEPLDRGNPPGLLEEPDQRAADRLVRT